MNKKLIKQIKELPGVKKIEPFDKRFIVTFEPIKQAVECKNVEQWDFIWRNKKENDTGVFFNSDAGYGHDYTCISITDTDESLSAQSKYYFETKEPDFIILLFSQYLTDYNLTGEWERYMIGEAEKRYPVGTKYIDSNGVILTRKRNIKIHLNNYDYGDCIGETLPVDWIYANGKWAEIIPNEIELVEGEVYVSTEDNEKMIFRFKSIRSEIHCNCYSFFSMGTTNLNLGDYICYKREKIGRICKPAIPNQIAKLIRAEIKNGYLWDNGKLITLKKK